MSEPKEEKIYNIKTKYITKSGEVKYYDAKKKYSYVPKVQKKKPPGRTPMSKEQKIEKLKKQINLLENTP
jgi:hypothetical protein